MPRAWRHALARCSIVLTWRCQLRYAYPLSLTSLLACRALLVPLKLSLGLKTALHKHSMSL